MKEKKTWKNFNSSAQLAGAQGDDRNASLSVTSWRDFSNVHLIDHKTGESISVYLDKVQTIELAKTLRNTR